MMIVIRFIFKGVYCAVYEWPVSVFKFIIYALVTVYKYQYGKKLPPEIKGEEVEVEEAVEARESLRLSRLGDIREALDTLKSSVTNIGPEVVLSPADLVIPSPNNDSNSGINYLSEKPHFCIDSDTTSGLSSMSSPLSSPATSRQDSIVEMYCDDEFKIGCDYEKTHLGLSNQSYDKIRLGLVTDIIDCGEDDLDSMLPFSVPSLLLQESYQESYQESNSLIWEKIEKDLKSESSIKTSEPDVGSQHSINNKGGIVTN